MKKASLFLVLCLIVCVFVSCAPKAPSQETTDFKVPLANSSMGGSPDKSIYSLDITLNSGIKNVADIKSAEIVAGEGIKGKSLEKSPLEIASTSTYYTIKGRITFDSAGMSKEQISNIKPYITAVKVTMNDGSVSVVPVQLS